jgi:signal peptidase II
MNAIGKWVRGVWIVLLVAAIVIGLDQATKEWVRINIPKYSHIVPIPALDQAFVFEHVDNFGAAFGILKMHRGVFIAVAAIVAVAILIYAPRLPADQKLIRVVLGLQMGGALGNAIDRMIQGYVTDFIRMGIPGVYYWPNYNIADSAIVIGVISLGVLLLREDIMRERAAKQTPDPAASGRRMSNSPTAEGE